MKIILLSKGKYFAQVDDEDFDFLNQWKWYAEERKNTFYAYRRVVLPPKIKVTMHRIIMGVTDRNIFVDHIDHNGLNNQV